MEKDLSVLTKEQLEMIDKLPEDMREGVRNLFIKQYEETNKAIAAAKQRTIPTSFTIEPSLYVEQVLENTPGLVTKLELIALSVEYMLPGCLTTAKEKYGSVFDKYTGIAFMQVIAATGVSKWKSKRDINDKMLNELRTLDPNYVAEPEDNELEEPEETEQEQEKSSLADLPIEPPKQEGEDNEVKTEEKPPKSSKTSRAA